MRQWVARTPPTIPITSTGKTDRSRAPRLPNGGTRFHRKNWPHIRGVLASNSDALLREQADRGSGVQAGLFSESGVRSSGSKSPAPGHPTPGLGPPECKVTPALHSALPWKCRSAVLELPPDTLGGNSAFLRGNAT